MFGMNYEMEVTFTINGQTKTVNVIADYADTALNKIIKKYPKAKNIVIKPITLGGISLDVWGKKLNTLFNKD